MGSKKELQTTENKGIKPFNELHGLIIDEYYRNGFNGVKAVLTVNPGIGYSSAGVLANTVLNTKENKPYIKELQTRLKASTNVDTENILKELLVIAYSDVTDYIGLSLAEIKKLPPEVRRCLQGIKIKTKKYKDRQGKEITEENIEFKLIDKLGAIDKINKYIGFYEVDNKQKANNINLNQISTDKLNILLELHNQIKGS